MNATPPTPITRADMQASWQAYMDAERTAREEHARRVAEANHCHWLTGVDYFCAEFAAEQYDLDMAWLFERPDDWREDAYFEEGRNEALTAQANADWNAASRR